MQAAADRASSTRTIAPYRSLKGCFITLEGIDGAGKSTHADWIVQFLRARGLPVMHTREPGGTPLGETLRSLLLEQPMHVHTELLLMFAARSQHLAESIVPHLEQGYWVVCDRFTDATYAYQGGGRKIAEERIAVLEDWVHQGLQPDCTFLFDIDTKTARKRLLQQGQPDRFEVEHEAFFKRTRQAYLQRADQFPQRFRILDSSQTIETIQTELASHLEQLIQQCPDKSHVQ